MKKIAFFFLPAVTAFLLFVKEPLNSGQSINPLLGDISYTARFGECPSRETSEDLRISTHLEYVERLLREKDVSHLSREMLDKRKQVLDLLHTYWTTGVFPRNYEQKDKRVPCFIDKDGRICAVGYLVEQTAGRGVAEQINKDHQYECLLAINDEVVDNWIAGSGLTEEECAMIQPAYGWTDNSTYINTTDAILSGGLSGMNAGLTALNFANTAKGVKKPLIPSLSLAFGLAQIGLGSYELWNYGGYHSWGSDYTAMKRLGITNIALGTATALIGTYTLLTNRSNKNKNVAWNVCPLRVDENRLSLGVCLIKRL